MKLPTITPTKLPYRELLQPTTLREFSGGWNASDDDLNLNYRFSTRMKNCFVGSDGVVRVRNGTKKFITLDNRIVNIEYFIDSLIAVTATGGVWRIFGDGTLLNLSSTLWGATEFVSFAKFNNNLIMCNGVDKPLILDDQFVLSLLQDLATATNINVPICKYVITHNRYLVMAGDPLEPNRVHISAKDAPGTWYGDPLPNDATRVDVGSVLPSATIIRGLIPFRGKLVVMFLEGLVFGTLGATNEEGSHTPSFDDGIEGFGSISHRAGAAYGDDVMFVDLEGVPSIKRTALSTSFKPERLSNLIDPEITADLAKLSELSLEERVFAVHNKRDNQFFLFVPNNDDPASTTETRVFVYNRLGDTVEAWNEFRGWNFTCGTRSLQGELFFGDANGVVWVYTGTTDFRDETVIPAIEGDSIEFDWELPWLDFGNRATSKSTKYISFDTSGASEFACTMYIDELKSSDGELAPALTTDFSGGDQGQFGSGPQPYGGGRNTSRKRKYAWPCKFQIAKFRFTGSSREGLGFVAITIHFLNGGINR